jgi:hypothetical protein
MPGYDALAGEIVMMDNLPAQEVAGVRGDRGDRRNAAPLPASILEQSFAKLKAHLILGTVTPEEPTTSDTPGMGQTKGKSALVSQA